MQVMRASWLLINHACHFISVLVIVINPARRRGRSIKHHQPTLGTNLELELPLQT